jgi:hypothetical protein
MDRKAATIELLKVATEAVELKRTTVERDLRKVICEEVYCKQFRDSVDSMTGVVSKVIGNQIKEVVSGLEDLTDTKSSSEIADILVNLVSNHPKWKKELVDAIMPFVVLRMAESATAEFQMLGVDIRGLKSISLLDTKSTASEWLENYEGDTQELNNMMLAAGAALPIGIGVWTELPESFKQSISEAVGESFSQDYWNAISQTTVDDIKNILEEGLKEGQSIRTMSATIASTLGSGSYAKMRATRIARTESANALNAGRSASMVRLQNDLGPQVPMKRTWMSVLAANTRDSHASLDGVPEDVDGMWLLAGIRIPYPGHWSLPAGEKINCLCTLIMEFGMQDTEAASLIQDYYNRPESVLGQAS